MDIVQKKPLKVFQSCMCDGIYIWTVTLSVLVQHSTREEVMTLRERTTWNTSGKGECVCTVSTVHVRVYVCESTAMTCVRVHE